MELSGQLLRADLLEGRAVVLAGPPRPALRVALAGLGAKTHVLDGDLLDEERTKRGAEGSRPADALVVDAAALFTNGAAGDDELAPLRAAADGSWAAVRAVATSAWIDAGEPGGRIVLVAPRPDDGPHAHAARQALENLARTSSIEWARFGIRISAITPGDTTTDDEIATLAAYLVSTAGEYFSGTRLDLGSVG